MNYVHRLLVVVAIAFLAVRHLNIPIQPVSKDASSRAEHLIDQMRVLVSIMLLKHNNHVGDACLMFCADQYGFHMSFQGVTAQCNAMLVAVYAVISVNSDL